MTAEIVSLVRGRYGTLADAPFRVSDVEMVAAERELGVRLPESYRTFLRHFGTSALCRHQFFGFSRDRLRGDLVLMNQMASPPHPAHLIQFARGPGGRGYYLDTSRADGAGECPVVLRDPAGAEGVLADSFLGFLHQETRG